MTDDARDAYIDSDGVTIPCTCPLGCPYPCKGECGCEACAMYYGDYLGGGAGDW